jgi:hypothetical protein
MAQIQLIVFFVISSYFIISLSFVISRSLIPSYGRHLLEMNLKIRPFWKCSLVAIARNLAYNQLNTIIVMFKSGARFLAIARNDKRGSPNNKGLCCYDYTTGTFTLLLCRIALICHFTLICHFER